MASGFTFAAKFPHQGKEKHSRKSHQTPQRMLYLSHSENNLKMSLILCPFLLHPGQSFPCLSWGSRWVGVESKAFPGCGYSPKPQGPTYSLNEGTHHLQRTQAGSAQQEAHNRPGRFFRAHPRGVGTGTD